MASLAKSSTVKQVDSHTYTADFDPAWTIGSGILPENPLYLLCSKTDNLQYHTAAM